MPAETVVPPRFRTPFPRGRLRALALAAAVCALAAVLCVLAPAQADAAPAGPFDVEGPADAYAWDGAALSVAGDGVAIVGMADPSSAMLGDVRVAAGVESVGLGADVRIGAMTFAGAAALHLDGAGNEVQVWNLAQPAKVGGSGSMRLSQATLPLDLLPSVSVAITGSAYAATIEDGAALVIEPGASVGSVMQFGGTLDLSNIAFGAPVRVLGYSVGEGGASGTIAAPFGATQLSELMTVDHLLAVGGGTAVVENGERVGTLQEDGSVLVAATRTVTFEGWGGQVLAVEEVPLFGAVTVPDAAAPDGYRFAGWDADLSRIVQDTTATAQFEKLPEPAPQPEAAPAASSGGSSASSSAGSTATPARSSKYYPAPSRLADTADAAGRELGAAAAVGSAAVATAVMAGAAVRRRG